MLCNAKDRIPPTLMTSSERKMRECGFIRLAYRIPCCSFLKGTEEGVNIVEDLSSSLKNRLWEVQSSYTGPKREGECEGVLRLGALLRRGRTLREDTREKIRNSFHSVMCRHKPRTRYCPHRLSLKHKGKPQKQDLDRGLTRNSKIACCDGATHSLGQQRTHRLLRPRPGSGFRLTSTVPETKYQSSPQHAYQRPPNHLCSDWAAYRPNEYLPRIANPYYAWIAGRHSDQARVSRPSLQQGHDGVLLRIPAVIPPIRKVNAGPRDCHLLVLRDKFFNGHMLFHAHRLLAQICINS